MVTIKYKGQLVNVPKSNVVPMLMQGATIPTKKDLHVAFN